jgi:excinuclease UvrABC ATPase subunit
MHLEAIRGSIITLYWKPSRIHRVIQSNAHRNIKEGNFVLRYFSNKFFVEVETDMCWLPINCIGVPLLSSRLFSFNSPIGACPTCKGFGNILDIDEAKVIPNPALSLAQGALSPFWMPSAAHEKKQLLEIN